MMPELNYLISILLFIEDAYDIAAEKNDEEMKHSRQNVAVFTLNRLYWLLTESYSRFN